MVRSYFVSLNRLADEVFEATKDAVVGASKFAMGTLASIELINQRS